MAIPLGVTSIDDYAFKGCTSLTSITIPASITSIGRDMLYGCTNMIIINVGSGNLNYKSVDGNLYTKDGKTLIQYAIGKTAPTFTIPVGVTSIGEDAFHDC